MDQDQLERAKIAMEEYRVLHAEILQRSSILMQISAGAMAVVGGIVGLAITKTLDIFPTLMLIALALAVVAAVWWFVRGDALKASARIAEIENFVNHSVGGDEINPLSWERRFGFRARGTLDRILGR